MKQLLRHWYNLFSATLWLLLGFGRSVLYFKTRALRDLALPHSAVLNSGERRRLQHYFYGTTYLGIVFCILRTYPRSQREKHLFTNLAALAYFFDDLVDTFRENDDSGRIWQDNPEEYGQTADARGLALHFLHNIYRELPPENLEQFKLFMHRVFNVETAGRQQPATEKGALASSDLEKITAEKGGFSVLLFRRVLSHPLSPEEQEAVFQFGYLVQLCDDIFDLWHDRQAGTRTLATFWGERNDIAGLSRIFEGQVAAVKDALDKIGRPKVTLPLLAGPGPAKAAIHFLVAITRVCLRHYADLQKKRGTLPLDNRAAMVVDMEKWSNRLRAMGTLLVDK